MKKIWIKMKKQQNNTKFTGCFIFNFFGLSSLFFTALSQEFNL